ncbi:MAG TPA: hypothetical protein VFH99_02870 [Candidatus Saccharimonadales bacterium]|nr:hypothetical protein [Candidatus Saccharimonadales bacterium]
MNVSSKQVYWGLLVLIALLLLALPVSAYKINGLLASRAQVQLKAKSEALDQEQNSFEIAQQNIKKYAGLEKIAQAIVPQDKSQAEAVREIVNIADQNGIAIGSLSFPPSSLGSTSGAGTSSSNSSASSAASASSPAANASSSQNKLSQLTSVSGIPGVYQLPITVTSDSKKPIQYNQLINFLGDLEHNRRTAQVNSISISPVGNGKYLTFVIVLNEYIKP